MNHQCVQLARIFYYKITWKDSYIICPDLNATCWFRYRKELNLEEKLYSEIEEGDLVIFEWGEYWHIAIVTKVDEKGFFLIQQNFFNDYRDVDFYISFDDLKKNLPLIDQNNTEYNITDFLRINKVFDKISK